MVSWLFWDLHAIPRIMINAYLQIASSKTSSIVTHFIGVCKIIYYNILGFYSLVLIRLYLLICKKAISTVRVRLSARVRLFVNTWGKENGREIFPASDGLLYLYSPWFLAIRTTPL